MRITPRLHACAKACRYATSARVVGAVAHTLRVAVGIALGAAVSGWPSRAVTIRRNEKTGKAVSTETRLLSRAVGSAISRLLFIGREGMDRLLDLDILPHAADVTIDDGNGAREDKGGAGAQPHDLEAVARRRERLPAALGS